MECDKNQTFFSPLFTPEGFFPSSETISFLFFGGGGVSLNFLVRCIFVLNCMNSVTRHGHGALTPRSALFLARHLLRGRPRLEFPTDLTRFVSMNTVIICRHADADSRQVFPSRSQNHEVWLLLLQTEVFSCSGQKTGCQWGGGRPLHLSVLCCE